VKIAVDFDRAFNGREVNTYSDPHRREARPANLLNDALK